MRRPCRAVTRDLHASLHVLRTLQIFASIYRGSASARRDAVKDYVIDYEGFLRSAGLHDGDDRELAERELLVAEDQSHGLFRIDRHPRSGDKQVLRLARDGGEAWLFSEIGETSPSSEREALARFFQNAISLPVPEQWTMSWEECFSVLSARALAGESVHPFRIDDPVGNESLLKALRGVITWQGESLIRYASTVICGDSKMLQALEARLRPLLGEITGHASLEDFGILPKPRSVTFHGPLVLSHGDAVLDFSSLPAPHTLSGTNLAKAGLLTPAPLCLSVENEDVFHELAKRNPGVLLLLTSFPGSAVLQFLSMLPEKLPLFHFGDTDPAGFDILRDLRMRTGRVVRPFLMQHRSSMAGQPLGREDIQTIERLLTLDLLSDVGQELEAMLREGQKGNFEQESIPVTEVITALRVLIDRIG